MVEPAPCWVCFADTIRDEAVLLHCGHAGLCLACADNLWRRRLTCPMCRHVIANQRHDCDAQEAPEAEVYQVYVQDGGVEMYVPVYVPVYDEDTPSEREVNEQDSEPEPEPEGDSDYVMSSGSDTDDE